jgi:ribosomal-protein-alanine N-acetyltransferase
MKLEDLPQVMAIENVSFPLPFSENLFRMELNLDVARLYVERMDDTIVGYIDYWHVGSEFHVITIATDPECRRRGIGSALMEFMLEDAGRNSVKLITLDVRPSNTEALALYRKYGFEQSGVRKRYYQDNGEDALILSKSSVQI